jgi:hypothetical protein
MELIFMDDGSAQDQKLIPIRMGQPTELVPIGIGLADEINFCESWVSPGPKINFNWNGSAD